MCVCVCLANTNSFHLITVSPFSFAAMEVNEVQNNDQKEVQQNRDERPPFIDINLDPSEEAIDA